MRSPLSSWGHFVCTETQKLPVDRKPVTVSAVPLCRKLKQLVQLFRILSYRSSFHATCGLTSQVYFKYIFPCFPVASKELKQSHYQLGTTIWGQNAFQCLHLWCIPLLPSADMSFSIQLFFRAKCHNSSKIFD